MSFLETLDRARSHLERNGRVSLGVLQREFDLDDESLEELVEELVEVQEVATREGRILVWRGSRAAAASPESVASVPDAREAELQDPVLAGERKQATVLFADIKDSTALTEQAGAEKWAGILDGYIRILEAGVRRFDGTVAQYTGDGIMALFGAPMAQEDHAQRACLSALWLRDALRDYAEQIHTGHGFLIETRIGLNSGEVVVGKIGQDLGVDYTAHGQTVHIAQRMEQLAESGRPCLAPTTADLVEGWFTLASRGEFDVKGVSNPLRVYALEGLGSAHSRLDAARIRGLSSFVGRIHEMELLDGALARARSGDGQIVGVVGAAGVGKSRLCAEFVERVRAEGLPVYSSHCLAHAQTASLLPIFELLRALTGAVSVDEGEAEQRQKIESTLLGLDPIFGEALPLVFDFLGVPDPERPAPLLPAEARQRQLSDFMQRLVRSVGDCEPSLIFIDDAHWIDSASDAFLARIVEAVKETRVLLLVNFRPEYHVDWMEMSEYQQLSLQPLGLDETAVMLEELVGDDSSVAGLSSLIRNRTGGNPFFVEEVVRSLSESGELEGERGAYRSSAPIDSLAVPDTVQPVLAGRIDRLADREKQVLQAAAVVGRDFSESILLEVLVWRSVDLSEALQELIAGEFIREKALYPVVEYTFKHPLTQEVALASQLGGRKARTHAAVARALEKIHSDRLDEQAALIASHYEGAEMALAAARWHERAAELMLYSGTIAYDTMHWKRVAVLLRHEPETPEVIRLRLSACTSLVRYSPIGATPNAERDRLAAEGRELADRLQDEGSRCLLELSLASSRMMTGWSEEGPLAPAERAVEMAESLDVESKIAAGLQLANTLFHLGRVPEALRQSDVALGLARKNTHLGYRMYGTSWVNSALWHQGCSLLWSGRPAEAAESFDECLEDADEQQAAVLDWIVGTWYGPPFEDLTGIPNQSLTRCQAAAASAEAFASPFMEAIAALYLGWAHLMRGAADAALECLLFADEQTRVHGIGSVLWNLCQGVLADAHLAAGDRENARLVADRCTEDRDTWGFELRAHISRSRVLRALDGADGRAEIEATLARAELLLERSGAHAFAPMIAEERARLAEVLGDAKGATRTLREALRLFETVGATGHVERLKKELAA